MKLKIKTQSYNFYFLPSVWRWKFFKGSGDDDDDDDDDVLLVSSFNMLTVDPINTAHSNEEMFHSKVLICFKVGPIGWIE